ncbi:MAG: hypothetical protein EBY21_03835 [Alphaproteobacteria bacterium]|nr:hypothetical protein [Alphaproteobacteria bacterium]
MLFRDLARWPFVMSLIVAGRKSQAFRAGFVKAQLIDLFSHDLGLSLSSKALGARAWSLIRIKANDLIKLYVDSQWASLRSAPTSPSGPHGLRESGYISLFKLVLKLKSCLFGEIMCKHPFTNARGYLGSMEVHFG